MRPERGDPAAFFAALERLRESDRLRRQVVNAAVHGPRRSPTSMTVHLRFLKDRYVDLVDDVFEARKTGAARPRMHPAGVDLAGPAEETAAHAASDGAKAGVTVIHAASKGRGRGATFVVEPPIQK